MNIPAEFVEDEVKQNHWHIATSQGVVCGDVTNGTTWHLPEDPLFLKKVNLCMNCWEKFANIPRSTAQANAQVIGLLMKIATTANPVRMIGSPLHLLEKVAKYAEQALGLMAPNSEEPLPPLTVTRDVVRTIRSEEDDGVE